MVDHPPRSGITPNRLKYKSVDPTLVPKIAPQTAGVTPVVAAHSWMGGIASTWGAFEQALDDTLWEAAKVDHQLGACLTSQIGSSYNKLIALEALLIARDVSPQLVGELNSITKKWNGLNQDRNRAVHDPIKTDVNGNVTVRRVHASRNTKGLVYTDEAFDFAWYESTKMKMLGFFNEFLAFKERVHSAFS